MPDRKGLDALPLFTAPSRPLPALVNAPVALGFPRNPAALPAGPAAVPDLPAPPPAPDEEPEGPPTHRARPRRAGHRYDPARVDWDLVRSFRQKASQHLAERIRDRPTVAEEERREIGAEIIAEMLVDHTRGDALDGRPVLDPDTEADLGQAVFDSLFGLGRLQPLMDLPGVENIEITGHDRVLLIHADGRHEYAGPVADSDEELVEFLAFLAARRTGAGERTFSTANPRLHLPLDGRARLAALMEVSNRPVVRIRKHRHTSISLADLRELGSIDAVLEGFLTAAVRARKSVVVSGAQGSGKTTLVRALAAAIEPWESVATLETEYELFLHEDQVRHPRCFGVEARPGSGELRPDGRRAGAITLEDLFEDVLRHNLDRIIVGEVRGGEAMAMFKAMQAGAGSISTTHAKNARDAIERLVTCVLSVHSNESYAARLVAQHVDVIVHLSSERDPSGGSKRRFVTEVIEVGTGEGHRAAVTQVFAPGADGRAVPRTPPSFLRDLERVGFDGSLLQHSHGTWVVEHAGHNTPGHHRPLGEDDGWGR